MTVPAGKYQHPITEKVNSASSRCQIQIICRAEDLLPGRQEISPALTSTDMDGDSKATTGNASAEMAPLRVLCIMVTNLIDEHPDPVLLGSSYSPKRNAGRKRKQGNSKDRPASPATSHLAPHSITGFISCLISTSHTRTQSQSSDTTIIFAHSQSKTVQPGTPNPNTRVMMYSSEKAMLEGWKEFVLAYDPDVITGYDVSEQLLGLMDRAERCGIGASWPYLSRVPHSKMKGSRHQIYGAHWVRSQR